MMGDVKVRKAVIAAAGFGTRFLPQTKAMPKEMLPLVDKPIIQYVVEELVEAGIEDIIIVTGYGKRSIEDHFDRPSQDLINALTSSGKHRLLESIEKISELANFIYVRQKGPMGNATPLINAEHLVGDEPFIYSFADDFVQASPPRFKQLLAAHKQYGGNILTCLPATSPDDYQRYGFVSGSAVKDNVIKVEKIVEKPGSKAQAPSDLLTVGGYVLEPAIFKYLRRQLREVKTGEEFVQQVSMQRMIKDGHNYFGCVIDGQYRDSGNKLEYMKTVMDFGLADPEIGPELKKYLKTRL